MKFAHAMLIAGFIFAPEALWSKPVSKDPFATMQMHKLKNGMTVVMAPSQNSKNVSLKLVVGFGRWSETSSNLQAGHVLEHMLFKDGGLADNKSYLELIKEAGGDVNAYVKNDHTAYYTTIPAEKSGWLIDNFRSMLFDRKIEEKELELAKSSVELEIGKPFVLNRWLKANPFGKMISNYFPTKDFYERELGVTPFEFSREDERLSVRKLKVDDIKAVYENYYHPQNMTILITGKFDPVKTLAVFESKFGSVNLPGNKFLQKRLATKPGEDFLTTSSSHRDSSSIFYGLKLYDRSARDILVVDAYLEYVSHRLMIELRNKKGETYTAYSQIYYENKGGYSYVSFQTPPDKYETNKKMLIDMIDKEARLGSISDVDIKKAIDLNLKERYELSDNDASGLMKYAELLLEMKNDFKEDRSPYQILSTMQTAEFKKILQENFNNQRKYVVENANPILFLYDVFAIILFSIMASVFIFKKMWGNKSDINSTVWLMKTESTPGVIPEIFIMFTISLIGSYLAQRPFEYFYEGLNFYRNNRLVSEYAETFLSMFVMIGMFMKLMSHYPTKILFTGKTIVINDLVLKERQFDISEVQSIEVLKPFKKYHPSHMFKAHYGIMSCLMDFFFWKSAISIKLKNGSAFVLNVKDASKLKALIEAEINVEVKVDEQVAA